MSWPDCWYYDYNGDQKAGVFLRNTSAAMQIIHSVETGEETRVHRLHVWPRYDEGKGMTPEGRIKKMVSIYLKDLQGALQDRGYDMHYSMFVPTGYGKRNTLDYTICYAGRFAAIETKRPDEDLTPLQKLTCRAILRSGGTVFVISGMEGFNAFKNWTDKHADWYA